MATTQDNIILTVLKAKCFAACQGAKLAARADAGEDIDCCEIEWLFFIELILIAETAYCKLYGTNGNLNPTSPNITYEELNELVSRLKKYMA